MSVSQTTRNYREASMLIKRFSSNEHMLAIAIVQLLEREKVRVLNKYLERRGEPTISTDLPRLRGAVDFEWVIDVPKEWISETGKGGYHS